jgi:hypothetical protein
MRGMTPLALTPDELLTTTRTVRKRLDLSRPVSLDLPAGVHQAALVPTAYYTGETFKPAAREPLDSVLHVDRW